MLIVSNCAAPEGSCLVPHNLRPGVHAAYETTLRQYPPGYGLTHIRGVSGDWLNEIQKRRENRKYLEAA